MAKAERVTARQRAILTAIIESYIDTGEPVGSARVVELLARRQKGDSAGSAAGLSPATVRNEMVELAEAGLLEQPHTCLL
jgi:heat-inducible transcriptional repressor